MRTKFDFLVIEEMQTPINLDCTPVEDMDQARRELLECSSVFHTLATYAEAKADAMHHRLNGNIPKAIKLEETCEILYKTLPNWAKW